MNSSNKYLGGEYSSHDLDKFIKSSTDDADLFFPDELNGQKRLFFETGTDALAYIISKKCKINKCICLWLPDNYCFETIERLKLKLDLFNIKISSVNKYNKLSDLHLDENLINFILLVHFNKYEPFSKINFGENSYTIEDFVQAPLDIKKQRGDYSFNSLRKLCNLEISIAYVDEIKEVKSKQESKYFLTKKNAQLTKTTFFQTNNSELENEYLNLFAKANEFLFNSDIQFAQPIEIQRFLSIDFEKIFSKRKSNYQYLQNKLLQLEKIKLIEGQYMYLMISSLERDNLKKFLRSNNIFTAIHWLDSKSEISNNILSIHIDHRYDLIDMDRIFKSISQFYDN